LDEMTNKDILIIAHKIFLKTILDDKRPTHKTRNADEVVTNLNRIFPYVEKALSEEKNVNEY
jgi:hypothetical protein